MALGAVYQGRMTLLAAEDQHQQGGSAETIFETIKRVREQAATIHAGELSAIAFDSGPGAFSGVRVGCGVAQGLGFAWNLPVVPVCSLLAIGAFEADESLAAPLMSLYLVAIDARMNEVYFAAYWSRSRPGAQWLIEPSVASAVQARAQFETLIANLRKTDAKNNAKNEPVFSINCLGNGFSDLGFGDSDFIASNGNGLKSCDARGVLWVAAQALHVNDSVEWMTRFNAANAAPLYVRNKVALDKVEQEHLRRQSVA